MTYKSDAESQRVEMRDRPDVWIVDSLFPHYAHPIQLNYNISEII